MDLGYIIKNLPHKKSSPVPSFGQTGEIKFRTMSFNTVDSLKMYLDRVFFIDEDKEITVTYEDAEQILNYIPTYFDEKNVNFVEKYDDSLVAAKPFVATMQVQKKISPVSYGTFAPLVRPTGYFTRYEYIEGLMMECFDLEAEKYE